MKRNTLLLCACCIPFITLAQSDILTRHSFHLKGKVQDVAEDIYAKSLIEKGPFRKNKKNDSAWYAFDGQGRLVEKMSSAEVNNADFAPEMTRYEYDEKGNLSRETVYELQENPDYLKRMVKEDLSYTATWMTTYRYDDRNRLSVVNGYLMPDKVLYNENKHLYNEKGQLREETHRDLETGAQEKTLYTYDDKGRLAKERILKADGAADRELRYQYDPRGNMTEYLLVGGDGGFRERETYTYDPQNRMTARTRFNKQGKTEQQITFTYDSSGNRLSATHYQPEGTVSFVFTYRYRYDREGNWISRDESKDNELIGVTERRIRYFKDPG